MPAFSRWPRLLFRLETLISGFGIRQQPGGQFHADGDRHEKIGQQHGQKGSRDFHNAPRAAPAHTLRVVKYRPAFLHESFLLGGTAGSGTSSRDCVRLLYSVYSIVRCVSSMKRIFSNPLVALAAGLSLQLFFVLKFPANSGDTVLYEQIAANWLKHHVYGMTVGGAVTPVDLRMPGYPAFLALIYALTGRTGADARLSVMLAQIAVDLAACVAIALLASTFGGVNGKKSLIA